jgi:hypothetical protein
MDEQYVSRVKEVLGKINAEAKIEVVTATEARYGRSWRFQQTKIFV